MTGKPQRVFALLVAALFGASLITAGSSVPAAGADVVYDLTIKTANKDGAGTNSQVQIKLYGIDGESPWIDIGCCFLQNKTDYRKVTTGDIGRIWRVSLKTDGTANRPKWQPESVQVARKGVPPSKFISWQAFHMGPVTKDEEGWPWLSDDGSFVKSDCLWMEASFLNESPTEMMQEVEASRTRTELVEVSKETTDKVSAGYEYSFSLGADVMAFNANASQKFTMEWEKAVTQKRVNVTETSQALSQKTTLKVPPQSLGLARRCQKVSWAVTTLDTGTEKRAVRTVPDDQAFGSLESWQYATFEFGENVPRRWANVIRRDPALREFVPDGELSRDGDFDLKDPDSGPPPKAKIVDDKAKTFKKYRTGWKRQAAGYRGRSFWTPVQANRVQRYATWRTQLAAPGEYGVYVYYPKKHATTRKAVYKITTKTGIKTRARNQKLTAGRWVKLGTFDFGWWGTVKLTDKTGERTASRRSVVFDAVKFVPVSPAVAATPKVVAPSVKRSAPKTTPPVAKPDGAVKIRLYPKTLDALVFARKTVSAWTCPADDRSPFGPDGRPGTGDDACDPIVAQWSLENEATGRLNKRTGHKVLVQMVDMEQNRLIAKWQDQVRPALLTPLPRPADKPAPRLITEP